MKVEFSAWARGIAILTACEISVLRRLSINWTERGYALTEAVARRRLREIEETTKDRIREAFKLKPRPGQIWRHHSGRLYRVDSIRNTTHPSEKFPPTICYTNIANGSEWSRRLDDWHRSFTFEADTP